MTRRDRFTSADAGWRDPLPWLGALLAAYLLLPLGALLIRLTGGSAGGLGAPGLVGALSTSVVTATITTCICALTGIPLAYVLVRRGGRLAGIVGAVVLLPLALPPLMSGILLVSVFGPYTVLGGLVGGHLTDSVAGIVLAQTFVAAPFTVVAARSAFAGINRELLDVSATLGWSEGARFLRVSLPLAAPGIRAGLLLTWLRAFGEFGATVILAYHPYTLPVLTYVQFSSTGLVPTIAPTAAALSIGLAVVGLSRLHLPSRNHQTGTRPLPTTPVRRPVAPLAFDLDHRLGDFHLRLAYQSRGNRIAILGPSGSGKSATLRCLAGLSGSSVGNVRLGVRHLEDVPVEDRRVAYVPQGESLFPNRTVWQQLLFAAGAEPGLASYWLEHLHLVGLENRRPHELSGGQRQRVALARALSRPTEVVLLDEPFSSLDMPVRAELRRELRQVQRDAGFTSVLVTHDPIEAAALADEVVVIAGGRILQAGPCDEVFSRPASPEVARLLGIENIMVGIVAGRGILATAGITLHAANLDLPTGTPVWWCVRPEEVEVDTSVSGSVTIDGSLPGRVVDVVALGSSTEFVVGLAGQLELLVRTTGQGPSRHLSKCTVRIPPLAITVWPRRPRHHVTTSAGFAASEPDTGMHT
jgi:ABC-type Fe3+/spermidine/putrescine transport system ATPase subunit/ABC-type sulfate transport system permease component